MMQQKRKSRWRIEGDPIVMLLASVCILSIAVLVYLWSPSWFQSDRPSSADAGFSCPVAAITDGDTLRCADGTRVRLHAVAARESDETCSVGHPCPDASGAAATAQLAALAEGQTLQCYPTGTSYDRVTAICRNQSDVEVNCAMVRTGTALIWPRFNRERAICN
ncbi:hypothetical protein WG907_09385 [Sphingobium sp. AN558]|uniref:thermonuclease family protein n=1 Tax=Sphingobium sp. AN558 TaxID=3133442 RepID=UPI0030BDF82E